MKGCLPWGQPGCSRHNRNRLLSTKALAYKPVDGRFSDNLCVKCVNWPFASASGNNKLIITKLIRPNTLFIRSSSCSSVILHFPTINHKHLCSHNLRNIQRMPIWVNFGSKYLAPSTIQKHRIGWGTLCWRWGTGSAAAGSTRTFPRWTTSRERGRMCPTGGRAASGASCPRPPWPTM